MRTAQESGTCPGDKTRSGGGGNRPGGEKVGTARGEELLAAALAGRVDDEGGVGGRESHLGEDGLRGAEVESWVGRAARGSWGPWLGRLDSGFVVQAGSIPK